MIAIFKRTSFFLLIILAVSCTSINSSEQAIHDFWSDLVKIIKEKDLKAFKEVSLAKINCKPCLNNSSNEKVGDKYDQFYGDLIFISIDVFIMEDFNKIFNADFISKLANSSKIVFLSREFEKDENQSHLNFLDNNKKYKLHEILIPIVDPSTQNEGEQKVIQVLETSEGFKFYGYSSIP